MKSFEYCIQILIHLHSHLPNQSFVRFTSSKRNQFQQRKKNWTNTFINLPRLELLCQGFSWQLKPIMTKGMLKYIIYYLQFQTKQPTSPLNSDFPCNVKTHFHKVEPAQSREELYNTTENIWRTKINKTITHHTKIPYSILIAGCQTF